MLSRLYVENYKCFGVFEYRPTRLDLLLGENGTGKSAVFDVLDALRQVVCHGTETTSLFPTNTLTAWEQGDRQTFELEFQGNSGAYVYRVSLQHDRLQLRNRIAEERLQFDGRELYAYDGRDAHLYQDDFSAGPVFPFDNSRSALATIPERSDNQLLTWFRSRLSNVYVFAPDPVRMEGRSESELSRPDRELHRLASWLRHLWQESVDSGPRLRDALCKEAIDGLTDVKLEKVSESVRLLKFQFDYAASSPGRSYCLSFDQLSTGQRNLVALYAIAHAAIGQDTTVCIDEPDNYVALRELQPWLTLLSDCVEDCGGQCLLISHNPELIDYLAPDHGVWFSRDELGAVRVGEFGSGDESSLKASELIARGWK